MNKNVVDKKIKIDDIKKKLKYVIYDIVIINNNTFYHNKKNNLLFDDNIKICGLFNKNKKKFYIFTDDEQYSII